MYLEFACFWLYHRSLVAGIEPNSSTNSGQTPRSSSKTCDSRVEVNGTDSPQRKMSDSSLSPPCMKQSSVPMTETSEESIEKKNRSIMEEFLNIHDFKVGFCCLY